MIEFERLTRPGLEDRGVVIRDAILAIGCGSLSLADALDQAWQAGYAAKDAEEAHILHRAEPGLEVLKCARHVIRQHPDRSIAARAASGWTWQADKIGRAHV